MNFEISRIAPNRMNVRLMDGDRCVQTSSGTILNDPDNFDDEVILQQEDAVALYVNLNCKVIAYLNAKTEEALALALDALDNLLYWDNGKPEYDEAREAITAIKQALDRKAENARELGLDYEPVATLFGSLPVYDITPQPAPTVQEPVAWVDLLKQAEEVVRSKSLWKKYIDGTPLANDIAVWMASFAQEHTTSPAAQRQWVSLTNEERLALEYTPQGVKRSPIQMSFATEDKLKEKNNG